MSTFVKGMVLGIQLIGATQVFQTINLWVTVPTGKNAVTLAHSDSADIIGNTSLSRSLDIFILAIFSH